MKTKRTKKHRNQLEFPLNFHTRKDNSIFADISEIRLKKKLLNQSAWWNQKRNIRVLAIINKLNKRPTSPVNESRIKRLRILAAVMLDRMKLEHKWHYAFKDELYEAL
jgi:hypothetical protein